MVSDSAGSQPPGWYHAQGDPEGTQRYWDGSQWVGGPQQAQDAASPAQAAGGGYEVATPSFNSAPSGAPASFGTRAIALIIDLAIMFGILIVAFILGFVVGLASDQLGAIVILIGAVLGGVAFPLWNIIVRQGQTGQTIGKSKQNIMLVSDETTRPVGIGTALIRALLGGLINSVCYIDYLWPLFDEQTKRLTDKVLNTSVVDV